MIESMSHKRSARLPIVLLAALVALAAAKANDKTHDVSIDGLQFKPAELKITAGQTVTWTNNDDRDHTVIGKKDAFKSGVIHRGGTFSFRFDKPGKYSYSCKLHPRMKGVIVVEANKGGK